MIHLNFKTSSNLSLIQFNSMCLIFKHLFKHLVNKGHSIPVLVAGIYNNTRYCYELKCGPGQRGFSGHSQRFPSLECEAYPRDLLVDCVWFKRAFTFVSEKRWHHNCHRLWWHCGCRFPFSRTLFPSSHVMYSADYFHRSLPVLYVRLSFHVSSTTSWLCMESLTIVQ